MQRACAAGSNLHLDAACIHALALSLIGQANCENLDPEPCVAGQAIILGV